MQMSMSWQIIVSIHQFYFQGIITDKLFWQWEKSLRDTLSKKNSKKKAGKSICKNGIL